MMAGIIFDLSGNWIEHMQCDEIMMQDRMSPWQLIYFGSLESLADPDGEMRFLKSVSMIDTDMLPIFFMQDVYSGQYVY